MGGHFLLKLTVLAFSVRVEPPFGRIGLYSYIGKVHAEISRLEGGTWTTPQNDT